MLCVCVHLTNGICKNNGTILMWWYKGYAIDPSEKIMCPLEVVVCLESALGLYSGLFDRFLDASQPICRGWNWKKPNGKLVEYLSNNFSKQVGRHVYTFSYPWLGLRKVLWLQGSADTEGLDLVVPGKIYHQKKFNIRRNQWHGQSYNYIPKTHAQLFFSQTSQTYI